MMESLNAKSGLIELRALLEVVPQAWLCMKAMLTETVVLEPCIGLHCTTAEKLKMWAIVH